MRTFSGIFLLILCNSVQADSFLITGAPQGEVCKFAGLLCSMHDIAGVRLDNGQVHMRPYSYAKVDQYSEDKKRCWIKTGGGVKFVEQTSFGTYKDIDVETVSFPCIKTT